MPNSELTELLASYVPTLIPPVAWGVRYSVDDFEPGGYHHEKGSSVLYSSYVTHHTPEIYSDPQTFNPYRWETIKPSA